MRIVFDVDGVIAEIKQRPYFDCLPIEKTISLIRRLKKDGHTIIFQTARYMKKYNGDANKAYNEGYAELILWLEKYDIPYDEVYFGKASADIYPDDKGFRFSPDKCDKFLDFLKKM